MTKPEEAVQLVMQSPTEDTTQDPALNVFAGMPPKGTIIAKLTEVELERYEVISSNQCALEQAGTVPFEQARKIQDEYRHFWRQVFVSRSLNYAWPVALDPVTGRVYINEKY